MADNGIDRHEMERALWAEVDAMITRMQTPEAHEAIMRALRTRPRVQITEPTDETPSVPPEDHACRDG